MMARRSSRRHDDLAHHVGPLATVGAAAVALVLSAIPHVASADPLVLRGPDVGTGLGFAIGYPDGSIGGWITRRIGLAFEWRAPGAIGASVGTRFTLIGRPRGAGLDLSGAIGVRVLRYDPGAALSATLALQARYRSDNVWFSAGLAAPCAFQLIGGLDARMPLLFELALAGRLDRVWLGVQGGAGMVFVPGLSPSLALQGTVTVTIPLGT